MLPEGCVSSILSLTSPLDACRSSLVSTEFRSALEFDSLWECFLPCDYHEILSKLVTPLSFSSKKDLFFRLCNDVLVDGGKKSFRLVKSTGKKCYTLSARELLITWSELPRCWTWIPLIESRFSEVAKLRTTYWLEIEGKIRSQMLSPNSTYGAYLMLKISDTAYGLDSVPSETSVKVGNQAVSSSAYLCTQKSKAEPMDSLSEKQLQVEMSSPKHSKRQFPRERKDGWMEIELGKFFNGDGDEEVKMSLKEVKSYQLKGGIIIEGIEIRPV